ncbi:Arylsulfatase [Crateriforma conspicua]|uniref:Arylsulfatase n=2 Tax=Crateriforma conspicua TaxID=2527996 RepID=A0A5C5XZP2_9PLAN|nr:Arylsulfatase [Crateriforma conspicua]TWT68364.1 Arylsulfatase [Crateriforma conspicua]
MVLFVSVCGKILGPMRTLGIFCLLVAATVTMENHAVAKARPNIIVFLVDDMGWTDSSVYGSTFYETPNLSRLAGQGMRMTQAYAQPLCSPSRAALLTGKYPARIGMHQAITGQSKPNPIVPAAANPRQVVVWPQSRSHLPLSEQTIAEVLREVGYQTWFLGKWHLGAAPRFWPQQQGFETVIGVGGAGPSGGYFAPNNIPALQPGPDGEYICERLTDEACSLISRRGDDPFFLYLSHFNVHSPYEAPAEQIERFAAKMDPANEHQNPVMAAMLYAMDQSLGKIMQRLDDEGIADDTWLFFLSDNGGIHWHNMKGQYAERFPVPVTSNAPLRGGKACFYEGGIRVPMVVRKPGKIAAGAVCDVPVHMIDLYPTLCQIAGADVPRELSVDGVSLLPILTETGSLDRSRLFCHFPRSKTLAGTVGGSFVRDGDYKLIRLWFSGEQGTHAYELYNLKQDVGEQSNLAEQMPQKVAEMAEALDVWLEQTGALLPRLNPKSN